MKHAARHYPRLLLLEHSAAYLTGDQLEIVRLAEVLKQTNLDTINLLRQVPDEDYAETIQIREAEIADLDAFLRTHQRS